MKELIYKDKDNLFQNQDWLAFQEDYGRKIVKFKKATGITLDLPFSKRAVWIQKAPENASSLDFLTSKLPQNTVFVRFEPAVMPENILRQKNIKKLTIHKSEIIWP